MDTIKTNKALRELWQKRHNADVRTSDIVAKEAKASASYMIEKDYTFHELKERVFAGKDSDWKRDNEGKIYGMDKAKADGCVSAFAYEKCQKQLAKRYERVEVGKDASGRKIYKLKSDAKGNPVPRKEQDRTFDPKLLQRAKEHGLSAKKIEDVHDVHNNGTLRALLEKLDIQRACQITFERMRDKLFAIKQEGNAVEVDDVLTMIREAFSTTGLDIKLSDTPDPKVTKVSRTVEVEHEDDDMELFKQFQQFKKMMSNG